MNSQLLRRHGFSVVGDGPSYVLAVERRSAAERAGLRAGDRLVEVCGCDVLSAPSQVVRAIMLLRPSSPPKLGVASGLRRVELVPRPAYGYGFILRGAYGGDATVVAGCEEGSPAYEGGLRDGDVVLELNGCRVSCPDGVQSVLDHQQLGKIRLGVLPMATTVAGRRETTSHRRTGGSVQQRRPAAPPESNSGGSPQGPLFPSASRVTVARLLGTKLTEVFGNDAAKKAAVIQVLKNYGDDRDEEKFVHTLDVLLREPHEREILAHLRSSVPPKDVAYFDEVLGTAEPKQLSRSRNNRAWPLGSNSPPVAVDQHGDLPQEHGQHQQQYQRLLYVRRVVLQRKRSHSFGLILRGHGPVHVNSVAPQSPAETAGVLPGDTILKVAGIDVRKMSHKELVRLLGECGDTVLCEVVQKLDERSAVQGSQSLLQSIENARGVSSDPHLTDFSARVSTLSSQNSDWAVMTSMLEDEEGRQIFKEKAQYLLTKKEQSTMKKLIKDYQLTGDIATFTESLSEIFDSRDKLVLWLFIMPLLPEDHHQYVLDNVPFTQDLLEDYQQSGYRMMEDVALNGQQQTAGYFNKLSRAASTASSSTSQGDTSGFLSTMAENVGHSDGKSVAHVFQRRLDFHLTSREREELMKTLQLYSVNGKIENLLEDAGVILDTPSKRSLWPHVITFIPKEHADFITEKLNIRNSYNRQGATSVSSADKATHGKEMRDTASRRGAQSIQNHSLAVLQDQADGRLGTSYYLGDEISGMAPNETIELPQELNGSYQFGLPNSPRRPFSDSLGDRQMSSPLSTDDASVRYDAAAAMPSDSDALENSDASMKNRMQQALQAFDDVMASEDARLELSSDAPRGGVLTAAAALSSQGTNIPPPPPPPPIPPPPPLPPNGFVNGTANQDSVQVKRINWETYRPENIHETVWAKNGDGGWEDFQDIVKYLELEQQFTTLKKTAVRTSSQKKKRKAHVLSDKKAYNTSIILAHLKTSVHELKRALLAVNENILTPELTSQLAHYAPDESEVEHYASYTGRIEELCHVDRFAYEMSRIPAYATRLRSIVFKSEFDEKCRDVHQRLRVVRMAAQEVHNSKKLARLLELVLAMGNRLNRGTRHENAPAFRITSLAKLDDTKTADQKMSFIHVLAKAAHSKVPELLTIKEELSSLPEAARFSFEQVLKEISEMERTLRETSSALHNLAAEEKHFSDEDRFEEVMVHFITKATDELQRLKSQFQSTKEEYDRMATYLGERADSPEGKTIFTHLSDFIRKFEQAHRHNTAQKAA